MNPLNLILASASPRRRRFLLEMGIPHQLRAADIDEEPLPHEDPTDLAMRLAHAKAASVANSLSLEKFPSLIIASDTVVAVDGETLGKPMDEDEASAMLRRLRGRTHQVHTAIVLFLVAADGIHDQSHLNTTEVDMRHYSDEEIVAYVSSGDPFDKAGGYAIQHRGFEPVAGLRGCPAGVMGLPLADLRTLLLHFGIDVAADLPPICRHLTGLICCQSP